MSTNESIVRPSTTRPIDRTALRVNQAAIVILLLVAFVVNLPLLVALIAMVMALGTVSPALALFQRIYHDILRPAGLLRPDLHEEDAQPHRFAQGMGAAVLVLASIAFLVNAPVPGWALALVVAALATVNLVFGFCAGCFIFFQIQRLRRAV